MHLTKWRMYQAIQSFEYEWSLQQVSLLKNIPLMKGANSHGLLVVSKATINFCRSFVLNTNPPSAISRYAMLKLELERRENVWGKVSLANDVCVQAWRAAAWIEFAFGRLGVTNGQASWLAHVGYGVLIGQARMSLRGQTCKAGTLLACILEERSIAGVWGKSVAGARLLQSFY